MSKIKVNTLSVFKGLLLLFVMLTASFLANAESSFDNKVSQQDVRLNVKLSSENVVIKEQIKVEVELLSLKPFASDFVLPYVDIKDAVIVSNNKPVTSSTRTIENQKWYSQKTQLSIFPTVERIYTIPSFEVSASIKTNDGEARSVTVSSQPKEFSVQSVLNDANSGSSLVVGDKASLSVATDRKIDEKLNVGDAVTFTYTLEVVGSNTIVLPEITLDEIKGTEIYRKPAVKENVLNPLSKTNKAVLKQSFTVIAQSEGLFELPVVQIAWWDTKNKKLTPLSVSKQTMNVGDINASQISNHKEFTAKVSDWLKSHGFNMLLLLIAVAFTYWVLNKLRVISYLLSAYKQYTGTKKQKKQFLSNIESKEYAKAVQVAYLITGSRHGSSVDVSNQLDSESLVTWQKLMMKAYADENSDEVNDPNVSLLEAKMLVECLLTSYKPKAGEFTFDWELNR